MSSPGKRPPPQIVSATGAQTDRPAGLARSVRRRLAIVLPIPIIIVMVYTQARKAEPGLRVTAVGATLDAQGNLRASPSTPAILRFSDGSVVELEPGGVARLVKTATLGGRVALETGRLVATVAAPTPMARWFFEVGPFELITPGGAVELRAAGPRVEVAITAGQAILRGPGTDGGLALRTDERLVADLATRTLERRPAVARPAPLQATRTPFGIATSAGPGALLPPVISALGVAEDGVVVVLGEARGERPADGLLLRDGLVVARLGGAALPLAPRPGSAAAIDARHVFVAVTQDAPTSPTTGDLPAKGQHWYGVRRHDRAGAPAPFSGGRGVDGSLLAIDEEFPVTALARGGDSLFVGLGAARRDSQGNSGDGQVVVYDVATLTERHRWRVPRPGALAATAEGAAVFVVGQDGKVRRHEAADGRAGEPLPGVDGAVALAMDPAGRLLVLERGETARVLTFELGGGAPRLLSPVASPERPQAVAGSAEVSAPLAPGTDPRGLGVTGKGEVIVALGLGPHAGAHLIALADATARWSVSAFVGSEAAALDPGGDGLDVYTSVARFRVDASGAAPITRTLDPWRFPDDPRLAPDAAAEMTVVRVAGRPLLVDTGTPSKIRIHRFVEGSPTAAPALVFGFGPAPALPETSPARHAPAWMWRDGDGDGKPRAEEYEGFDLPYSWAAAVDADGALWRATSSDGIDRIPCEGLDERGVPRYRLAARERIAPPRELPRLQRLALGQGGTVYLAGFTDAKPSPYKSKSADAIGTELLRYDDFRGARVLRWRRPLVDDEAYGRRAVGLATAGGRVFVAYAHDPAIHVLDAATGVESGTLRITADDEPYDPAFAPVPLRAFARAGEVVLFAADPVRSRVVAVRLRD